MYLVGMQNRKTTLENSLAVSYKGTHTLAQPAVSFLGIYLNEMKTHV